MTKIEWTDETWNFLGGCSPVSEGCRHCAAARQAAGRLKNHPLYKGLTKNGRWTGEIRLCTNIGRADILEKPRHWRSPRMIFPCFMGDLFHKKVPFEFIDKVRQIMRQCPQHTFQVLTKRPEILYDYCEAKQRGMWPRNIWIGVSISTQEDLWMMDKLIQIPAAIRFISFEPLLEDINPIHTLSYYLGDGLIDWVIVGGESGPKRRPCKLEWVRDIADQCKVASIPVFIKQLSINGKVERDIAKFPKDLQIREYPNVSRQK